MNNLEKIQKTMKVFQTLTKIVMVSSFVAIAFTLVAGSVSLMADKLPFGELLQRLLIEADRTIDNREIGIALLCESVVLIFGAIEAICVCRYFKLELSEGTPFTETGAKSITKLGILFIVGESSEQVRRLVVVDLPGALPLETLAWSPVE